MPYAAEEAVTWAIKERLLGGFFERQRAEVIGMILTEFDEELFRQNCREDGYEDGYEDGARDGARNGAKDSAVKTASNFLKMGVLTAEQISQGTGLSLEEVKGLAEKILP